MSAQIVSHERFSRRNEAMLLVRVHFSDVRVLKQIGGTNTKDQRAKSATQSELLDAAHAPALHGRQTHHWARVRVDK